MSDRTLTVENISRWLKQSPQAIKRIFDFIVANKSVQDFIIKVLTAFTLSRISKSTPPLITTTSKEMRVMGTKYSKTKLVVILVGLLGAGLGIKKGLQYAKWSMSDIKRVFSNIFSSLIFWLEEQVRKGNNKVKQWLKRLPLPSSKQSRFDVKISPPRSLPLESSLKEKEEDEEEEEEEKQLP
jgi:hypothetical protein